MKIFSPKILSENYPFILPAFIERAKMTEHTFMIIIAIIIGVLAGFSAIGIRALIKGISLLSYPGWFTSSKRLMHLPGTWF